MADTGLKLERIPEAQVYPELAAVLEPQEQVYWQGRPVTGPRPVSILGGVLFIGVFAWSPGFHETMSTVWQES